MNDKRRKSVVSAVIVIIAAVVVFISNLNDSKTVGKSGALSNDESRIMTVSFIDVKQGDCELIRFPDGRFMLIDSGENYYCDSVEKKLESSGCDKIDFLVITHPHTDHMGGMSSIISDFDIGEIYMPYAVTDTRAYENLLESINDKGLMVNTAKAGEKISISDEILCEFLAPVSKSYDELNNYSAVLKVSYNDSSFLFTGDAEELSENEMLERSYSELDCDVLKVGHHGSKYSSGNAFLDAVSPDYAVIECGLDNTYGHPHKETIDKLEKRNVDIYRTDLNGTVEFYTDGDAFEVEVVG